VERFNLRKQNDVEVKEQYQVKISNRFAALENLVDDAVDISRAWESIVVNMKTLPTESIDYCESKLHKPWIDEEYSTLLDHRRWDKLQCLQNSSQTNGD